MTRTEEEANLIQKTETMMWSESAEYIVDDYYRELAETER